MDKLSKTERFDNSVRAREAVRSAARRLVEEMGYTANRQANLINAFLNTNRGAVLPLREIKASTWTDFIRAGSTRVPLDLRIVHAGWLWIMEEAPHILLDELGISGAPDDHAFRGLFESFLSQTKTRLTEADIKGLIGERIKFAYKFDDRGNIAVGNLNVGTAGWSEVLKFHLTLPYFDSRGNTRGQTFAGDLVPFHSFVLLLGCSGYSPLVMVSSLRATPGWDRVSGRFIYENPDGDTQYPEFLTFLDKSQKSYFIFNERDHLDYGEDYALIVYQILRGNCSFSIKFV